MSFVDSLKKGLFGSEDDYDDQGEYWGNGCEYMCNYEMRPVPTIQSGAA